MAWTTSLSASSFQYRPSFTAPRQAFASYGSADLMRQFKMQSNRLYKIPADGARLIGSLPYRLPSIAISWYFWKTTGKEASINVGVVEGDEDSPATQTSDEANLKHEGTFSDHQI
jgi:hypothetical protein